VGKWEETPITTGTKERAGPSSVLQRTGLRNKLVRSRESYNFVIITFLGTGLRCLFGNYEVQIVV
jgi:hypothetical protein